MGLGDVCTVRWYCNTTSYRDVLRRIRIITRAHAGGGMTEWTMAVTADIWWAPTSTLEQLSRLAENSSSYYVSYIFYGSGFYPKQLSVFF